MGAFMQNTAPLEAEQFRELCTTAVAAALVVCFASPGSPVRTQFLHCVLTHCVLFDTDLQQADAGLDLLAVHVDLHSAMQQQQQPQQEDGSSSASPASTEAAGAAALLGWLDKTLRYLNNSAAFKDAVLLTVLATPGSSQQPAAVPMLAQAGGTPLTLLPSGPHIKQQQQQPLRHVLKPLQSWEQLAGQPLAVSKQRAILCLRRLPGVIRRDDCSRFSLSDCCASSGTLALLADRLLPEVAYKLGRAPKYGA